MNFKKEILNIREDFLNDLSEWIQIPSVTNSKHAKKALKFGLELGEKMGFECESFNKDSSGHIKFGSDDDFIGVLGHVDVVPVNPDEWDFDPFSGEYDSEYLNGRGTQDDKGPLLCALYALKIIKDMKLKSKKGVRVIMGTQEEGGDWGDIEDYFKKNPTPSASFTPDSDFPIVYAEKSIVRIEVSGMADFNEITSIHGGNAINSVSAKTEIKTIMKHEDLKGHKDSVIDGHNITFLGKACHAMECFKGDPAIWKAMTFLHKVSPNKLTTIYTKYFLNDHHGEKAGFAHRSPDEGDITVNTGIFNYEKGKFNLIFDLRIPNDIDFNISFKKFQEVFEGYDVKMLESTQGIFHDKNSPLVKTLLHAYRNVTGDKTTPMITMGGGTYAKAIPNCIAFGPMFPGEDSRLHQKNERANIANMLKAIEIYCHAIYDLIK